jgi:hypothetical protein
MQINRITVCRFRCPAENLMKPAWPRSVWCLSRGALRAESSGECGSECACDADGLPCRGANRVAQPIPSQEALL